MYCRLLRVRLLRLQGESADADALQASILKDRLLSVDALSKRWLINWRSELDVGLGKNAH